MKDPENMKDPERAELLRTIQRILWWDEKGELDPDKEWNADTASDIAEAMKDAGIGPKGD